jgi:Ca2+-binding RTX toxin-like protein
VDGAGGKDRVRGDDGDDRVRGGVGDDRVVGDAGTDRIFGGAGNDVVDARDGEPDRVDCGPGRDLARLDRRDRLVRGCERLRTF